MTRQTKPAPFEVAEFVRNFDHHTIDFGQHINDIFRHMRSNCPVSHSTAYGGFWVLTRHDDIARVARDDEIFSLRAGMGIPSNRKLGDPPFVLPGDLDPPQSLVYRRLLEPLVTPKALSALTPFLQSLARDLVNDFIETGSADLVRDLAAPLTAIVTLRLAGLPEEDWRHYVSERRETAATRRDPEDETRRAGERFTWTCNAFKEQIAIQRRHPVDGGLIARLLEARIDGRALNDAELMAIMINFVAGGLETTQALLGSAWVHLGRHPDQREDLRANLDSLPGAVEEMLRFFTPQPGLARVATRDTDIGGITIREGEKVFMCWASANRDESIFQQADKFDIRRRPNRHLAFGIGAHHCVGANLTRLESRVCMAEVLSRLPGYSLIEAELVAIPDVSTVYGYLSVPIKFACGTKIG